MRASVASRKATCNPSLQHAAVDNPTTRATVSCFDLVSGAGDKVKRAYICIRETSSRVHSERELHCRAVMDGGQLANTLRKNMSRVHHPLASAEEEGAVKR